MGDADRAGSLDVIRLRAARPPATLNTASPRIPRRGEAFAVPRLGHDALVKCVICGSPDGRAWGSYGPTPACEPCHSDWVSQQRAALAVKPTCLYRLYNAAGQLLYVGITSNTGRRWKEHRKEHQEWWPRVAERREAWYLERNHAWYAEREAVWAERPLHNDEAHAYTAGTLLPLKPDIGPTPRPPAGAKWWRVDEDVAAYTLAWKIWLAQLRDASLTDDEWVETLVGLLPPE